MFCVRRLFLHAPGETFIFSTFSNQAWRYDVAAITADSRQALEAIEHGKLRQARALVVIEGCAKLSQADLGGSATKTMRSPCIMKFD